MTDKSLLTGAIATALASGLVSGHCITDRPPPEPIDPKKQKRRNKNKAARKARKKNK